MTSRNGPNPKASMPVWAEPVEGGWLLKLRVQPGARRSQIVGLHDEELKVSIAAAATDDKANKALVKFLAKTLGVAPRTVTLTKGQKSRSKRVVVADVSALDRLIAYLPEGTFDTRPRAGRSESTGREQPSTDG